MENVLLMADLTYRSRPKKLQYLGLLDHSKIEVSKDWDGWTVQEIIDDGYADETGYLVRQTRETKRGQQRRERHVLRCLVKEMAYVWNPYPLAKYLQFNKY